MKLQPRELVLPLASCYLTSNRISSTLRAAAPFVAEGEVWEGYIFKNVVFLEPELIRGANERQTVVGLWIANDLWVNSTSWETVNRLLTFILAKLHLLELKTQRKTGRGMNDREDLSNVAASKDFKSWTSWNHQCKLYEAANLAELQDRCNPQWNVFTTFLHLNVPAELWWIQYS